jgi:ketopantoate reductase
MENDLNNLEIVIYGAGAVGASICGWLTPHHDKIFLLARGEDARIMKSKGLIMYQHSLDN